MARHESLIQWASSNRHRISLEAKEFDWAWKKGIPLFDFEVQLQVDGFKGVGRGSDPEETTALTKAVAEALERAVCTSLGISTVGVAAHTVSHLARENARLEALERHAFERHLKNREKFIPFDAEISIAGLPEMRFFRMGLPDPYHALLCFLSDSGEKLLGLSCSTNPMEAMNKAALEVLRNQAVLLDNPAKFRKATAEDPNLWCCRGDFLTDVEALFGESSKENAPGSLPSLCAEKIEMTHLPALAECPIFLERASIQGEDL